MSVQSKMTAIADPIRTLSGETGKLSLDQMAAKLTAANGDVTNQTDLIAQIMAAVEGKAGGGASGGAYTGTFTPASYTNEVSFGVPIPESDFFVVVTMIGESTMPTDSGYSRSIYVTSINGVISGESRNNSNASGSYPVGANESIRAGFDRNTNTMKLSKSGTVPAYFYGGQEYIWFMGALST